MKEMRGQGLVGWLAVGLCGGWLVAWGGNAGINVGVGQTANITMHTNTWNFGVTSAGAQSGLTITNIGLTVNIGNGATAPVTLTLYSGLGGTGTALYTTNIPYTAFQQGAAYYLLNVAIPSTLLDAGGYSVRFSTTAPGTGNDIYRFKGGPTALDSGGVPVEGLYWAQDQTTDGSASTNFNSTDVFADFRLSGTNISYGNFRINSTLSTQIGLTNAAMFTASNTTEKLYSTGVSSGQAVLSGLTTDLLAVNTYTNFSVGMNSASVGTNSGSVSLTFASYTNGTKASRAPGGPTNIASGVINVSGVGYRLAAAGLSGTNINFGSYHLNDALNASLGLTNTAANDGYSEKLSVSTNDVSANLTIGGVPIGLLGAQVRSNITVGLNSASVGTNSGSFTLGYASDGAGTSGLVASNLGNQVVNVIGVGYQLAAMGMQTTNVNLGRIHENGTFTGQYLVLTNTAPAGTFSESLVATFGAATGGATGTGSASNIVAGSVNSSSLLAGLNDNTAGDKLGTLQINATSREVNGSGLGYTGVAGQGVTVAGFVYTGRSLWNTNASGTWNNYTNWDVAGGTPGLDGSLSTNDAATFAAGPTSGTTTINLDGASPSVRVMVFSNAASSYEIATGSGGSLTIGSAGYTGSLTDEEGNHTLAANLGLGNNLLVSVTRTNDTLLVSGIISGASGQVTKTGPGRLNLTAANTYLGTTLVNGGLLSVNGRLQSAALIVSSDAFLGGTGTIAGATTILAGGTLAPGNSPGILTFTNGVAFSNGAHLAWELTDNTNGPALRGVAYDGLNLTGGNADIASLAIMDLDFSSAGSLVDWNNSFWDSNQTWLVLYNTGGGNLNGIFDVINVGLDTNAVALTTVRPRAYFYTSNDGADNLLLNYVSIPEPASLGLLFIFGFVFLLRRRFPRMNDR